VTHENGDRRIASRAISFTNTRRKRERAGDKEIGEETTVQIARELLRRELKDRGGLPLSEAPGGKEGGL